MADWDEVRHIFENATVAGPASTESVASATDQLKVTFPKSYLRFLESFGAAMCDGFEIAGVFFVENPTQTSLWQDVVTKTRQSKRYAFDSIPAGYVAISDDGCDVSYYLATAQMDSDGECPVVALGPGIDGVEVASDFVQFIALLARDELPI